MDEAFAVDEVDNGDSLHVVVRGELDVATAPTLRERLHAAVDRSTGPVIVDLLAVTFIDSTALGVLIGTKELADKRGIDLRLVIEEARIIKIFEITGLTELFSISATVAEASAS
jgi:anti-sigma B factor antagonist